MVEKSFDRANKFEKKKKVGYNKKMKYILYDKTEFEMDIITDILAEEHISYKTSKHAKEYMDCPFGKAYIIVFDIEVETDFENLEFVKFLADKRIKERKHIARCFDMLDEATPVKDEINSWAKSIIDKIKKS